MLLEDTIDHIFSLRQMEEQKDAIERSYVYNEDYAVGKIIKIASPPQTLQANTILRFEFIWSRARIKKRKRRRKEEDSNWAAWCKGGMEGRMVQNSSVHAYMADSMMKRRATAAVSFIWTMPAWLDFTQTFVSPVSMLFGSIFSTRSWHCPQDSWARCTIVIRRQLRHCH